MRHERSNGNEGWRPSDDRFNQGPRRSGERPSEDEQRRWTDRELDRAPRDFERRDFDSRNFDATSDVVDRGRAHGDRDRGARDDWGFREGRELDPTPRAPSRFQVRPELVGKGPKGYARSDERIHDEVCNRLSQGYLDASDVEVSVKAGAVTLSGTVRDRQSKRLAEDVIEDVGGVKDVENHLKVGAPRAAGGEEPEKPHPGRRGSA